MKLNLRDKIEKKINQEDDKNIVLKRMRTKNKFKKYNKIKRDEIVKKKKVKRSIKQRNRASKHRGIKSDKKNQIE